MLLFWLLEKQLIQKLDTVLIKTQEALFPPIIKTINCPINNREFPRAWKENCSDYSCF